MDTMMTTSEILNTGMTCLTRVPARFNDYPHYLDKVLIKISEIKGYELF